MIILDYKDTRPLYEQIVDKFQRLVLTGGLEPNTKMPSVRVLAAELSVNPNTIQRAYSELERQGFIYTVKGRGNFVAYDEGLISFRRDELYRRLEQIAAEAAELGIDSRQLAARLLGSDGTGTEGRPAQDGTGGGVR